MKIIVILKNKYYNAIFISYLSYLLIFFPNFIFADVLSKDTIEWATFDWPPGYIISGPDKGRGFVDLTQKMIIDELKNYNHKIKVFPLARLKFNIKNGRHSCYGAAIYSKHYAVKNGMLIGIPYLLQYPHQILILKSKRHLFNDKKIVKLDYLLKNTNLRLTVQKNWSLGPIIDNILKKNKSSKNIHVRASSDGYSGLLKMVKLGRTDYIINYYSSFKTIINDIGFNLNDFEIISIYENKDTFHGASFSVSDNMWGKKIISEINQVVFKLRKDKKFRRIIENHLIPKGHETKYWKLYKQKIISQNHNINSKLNEKSNQ
ncbi:MAG: hypothetical protein GY714_11675 [Desulfobacterales bacterium]|nr:hypothetical protein [Desulfobacterales bacterium]